nr:reverse transcriptase domain-containing protein [Tanacetum cinerariifolium]
LDAYKGYHQIQLAEPDEEKTAFHTGQGVYCYTRMPFGLKNAGATYQRLMDKAFDNQIGRNIEVYIDDLVVKSYTEAEMLRNIDETFSTLQKINMKLNPNKCTFGVVEGVFLGYVVTPDGIKSCSDKTAAVLQLPSSRTIKEVQSLNGKLAIKHPQSNELVERVNRSLGEGTKACLDVVSYDKELRLKLDLLEERRERAVIYEAKAKLKMMKYYNARVRGVTFRPCDFVYRSNDNSHAVAGGKLGPK